ncbi:oleoyl-acyl carrier protein thioesterase 1, chloroplastic-like [Phalaenopsis equestris]|uniref:oleoyl-acyl carrier protein thioesterase 1, chloroplastic-like n=1 Tax=Phalaenopsis equestris TaxID=78828 RepID=UPI0009E5644D|nr:oleoyl-acyl carrier protein thioesterase 1, chloroplastic-like [Phalaenopsis equestris]
MLLNCAAVSPAAVRDAPAVAQCRRRKPSVFSPIRRAEYALAALRSCRVGPEAVGLCARETEEGAGKGFAERLRLGRLEEDGLSYKESFIVRCYEVGINKTATVETIANLLQEVGCNHAQSVGFSTDGFATTTTMRELRLIWVTSRMHIEIYEYPAWGDVVEIETWCQGEGRIGTRRDWILKDLATGLVIGRATSKWVMMNQDTRKLQRVSDEVKEEYLVFCPQTPRFAFPEEENDSLKKIAKLEDPTDYSRLGLVPRRADLDMNQHVNNVTYIGWVLESMPQEIIDTHELQTITLDYRRECQHDDVVDSLTSSNSEEILLSKSINGHPSKHQHSHGSGHLHFLHFLRLSGTGLEINRGRTVWRKLIR